jgi:S1-C subfamily serine protease
LIFGYATIGTLIVNFFLNLYKVKFLQDAVQGKYAGAEEEEMINQISILMVATYGLLGMMFFILFLIWLNKSFKNLLSQNIKTRRTPAMAVLAFFIPFYNFVAPYLAVNELWDESKVKHKDLIIKFWWGIALSGMIFSRISRFFEELEESLQNAIYLNYNALIITALLIANIAFLIKITKKITEAQWKFKNIKDKVLKKGIGAVVIISTAILVFTGLIVFKATNYENKSFENTMASVVSIYCPVNEFSLDGEMWSGSGVMIDPEGMILSNQHIIPQNETEYLVPDEGCIVMYVPENEAEIESYLAIPKAVYGLSEEYDLAFFEIYDAYINEEEELSGTFPRRFDYIDIFDGCYIDDLGFGDFIYMYGFPDSGQGYFIATEGIISSFTSDKYIYTSANTSQGNSGGAAVDAYNCFIGIPSYSMEGESSNLGAIISLDLIEEFFLKAEEYQEQEEEALTSTPS